MKLRTSLLAGLAALALSTAAAHAVPISGSYALTVAVATSDTVDLSMASRIMFSGSSMFPANTVSTFSPSSFTPASVTACANCGVINNILNIPAGSATTPFTAINPLFSVQGLSFSLNALTQVIRTSNAQGTSIELKGTGIYSASGYDNTAGTFDITIQNGSATMLTAASASASGTVTAVTVPEPTTLALLGGSLAAVGLIRRRKQG